MRRSQIITFLLFGMLFIFNVQLLHADTNILYVGQYTYLAPPDPPSDAAISQASWGSSGSHLSVERYSTTGAKVTVKSYFTGTEQVQCDYYYYWYDQRGAMHTNRATTYYNFQCRPVSATINPTSMQLKKGERKKITYSYSPQLNPKPTFYLSSSNTRVATVEDGVGSGYVTAVGAGTTTITLSSNAGPDVSCTVTVKATSPTSISLPSAISLTAGDREQLTATVYPTDADYTLIWESNDESVAKVSSSGMVTARKDGNAIITAKVAGTDLSDYCYIRVGKQTLTLSASPSESLLSKGDAVTLTASNDDAEIYYTLNGKAPTKNSNRYSSPIIIEQNTMLKAIAFHPDYNPSEELVKTIEVTSLRPTDYFPGNNTTAVITDILPCITFNDEIFEGPEFANIGFTTDGNTVDGDIRLMGNKVVVVPETTLDYGASYTITLPQNAIQNAQGEINKTAALSFNVVSETNNPYADVIRGAILKSDGRLYMWGHYNPELTYDWGFTYPDPDMAETYYPTLVYDNILSYKESYNHYYLTTDRILYGWGVNFDAVGTPSGAWLQSAGYLGDGTKTSRKTPVIILNEVREICTNTLHQAAIKTDDTLWGWGRNRNGQIGNGRLDDEGQSYPVKVLDDVKSVALGKFLTAAIKNDGSLWICGDGTDRWGPTLKKIMSDVKRVSCGNTHALALKANNTLWIMGNNDFGQLGDGTTEDNIFPCKLMDDVVSIVCGQYSSLALKSDGSLWRWGTLWFSGTSVPSEDWLTPRKVLDNVKKVKGDDDYCFALKEDGSLWGMGAMFNNVRPNPKDMVQLMSDVADFWISGRSYYALKTDGSLWGWCSSGDFKGIGDGTKGATKKPVCIMEAEASVEPENVSMIVDQELSVGTQTVAMPVIQPADAHIYSIDWVSSDQEVATVSERGLISAHKTGICTISLSITSGTTTLSCSQDIAITPSHLSSVKDILVDEVTGVEIYNLSGIRLKNDMNELPAGIYIVKTGAGTRKVIIR